METRQSRQSRAGVGQTGTQSACAASGKVCERPQTCTTVHITCAELRQLSRQDHPDASACAVPQQGPDRMLHPATLNPSRQAPLVGARCVFGCSVCGCGGGGGGCGYGVDDVRDGAAAAEVVHREAQALQAHRRTTPQPFTVAALADHLQAASPPGIQMCSG